MTLSVLNICDEVIIDMCLPLVICGQHFLYRIYYDLNDLDILLLVMAADIILLTKAPFFKHHVDGLCVIHDIQPVTHVLAVPVYRQLLARQDIIDDERDELFRELVWSVVITAVRYHGREMICVNICLYHEIR